MFESESEKKNREYADGYKRARSGDLFQDETRDFFVPGFVNSETYEKGYKQGQEDRWKYGRPTSGASDSSSSSSGYSGSYTGGSTSEGGGFAVFLTLGVFLAIGIALISALTTTDKSPSRSSYSATNSYPSSNTSRIGDNRTYQNISSESTERNLGLTKKNRRSIQRFLILARYRPGADDGIFGTRTRAAIREWQKASGFNQTGFLNAYQASMLGVHKSPSQTSATVRTAPSNGGARVAKQGRYEDANGCIREADGSFVANFDPVRCK